MNIKPSVRQLLKSRLQTLSPADRQAESAAIATTLAWLLHALGAPVPDPAFSGGPAFQAAGLSAAIPRLPAGQAAGFPLPSLARAGSSPVLAGPAPWSGSGPACPLVTSFVPGPGEPDILPVLAWLASATPAPAPGATGSTAPAAGLVRLVPAAAGSPGMEVRLWDGRTGSLARHPAYPILEPRPDLPLVAEPRGLVLVPGLGFTASGRRLGRGGGHYDRFLAAWPGLWRLGVAFGVQLLDDLPLDPHDMAMDALLTGQGLMLAGPRRPDLPEAADFSAQIQYLVNTRRT